MKMYFAFLWVMLVTGTALYVIAILAGRWDFVLLSVVSMRWSAIDLIDDFWKTEKEVQ